MKVADLFARLFIRTDRKSFDAGNRMIDGIKGQLAGLATMAAAVGAVRSSFSFSKQLTDLDIASSGAMGSLEDVRSKILEVSDETGVAREEITAGSAAFVALTGDGKAAAASMETFAKVHKATGAEMRDVTSVAARLQQNMNIDPSQFEKSFSILIASGKAGAIELKEMASLFGGLTPAAEKFAGGKGLDGLAKLSAGLQLVMQGAGSPAQAATMFEALMGSISGVASKRLAEEGIQVFNKDGSLRELDVIIDEIKNKNFRRDKLIEIFGRKEAVGAFEQLVKVEGAWQNLTNATLDADDVAKDYAKRQQSDTAKVEKAWNKVRNTIERVSFYVVKALAWVTDNMALITIGALSLAAAMIIVKAAAIGAAIASAAAWLIALAPFVLIAAAIAAIILIVEDLYVWIQGGDSLFKAMYESAKKWIEDKLAGAFDKAKDAAAEFLDVGGIFGVRDAIARRRQSEAAEAAARADLEEREDMVSQRADESNEIAELMKTDFAAAQKLAQQRLAEREKRNAEFAAKIPEIIANVAPFRSGESLRPSTSNNMNATITVNATPGTDADGVGEAITTKLSDWWNLNMREAAAAIP